MKITIGIDPDATAHGVAVYQDGKLATLETLALIQIVRLVDRFKDHDIVFSIEDVIQNKFVYARNMQASKASQSKVAMQIGRCQQAQVELVRWLDHLGVKYQLHKPQKGNWAKQKAIFEKATGWAKRSNEDTRSAAYFGYLAIARVSWQK